MTRGKTVLLTLLAVAVIASPVVVALLMEGADEKPVIREDPPPGESGKRPVDRVLVDHILISFEGNAQGMESIRPRGAAERLAERLYERLRDHPGDWLKVKREHTDDPSGPRWIGTQEGLKLLPNPGGPEPIQILPKASMGLTGKKAFEMDVGEIALVPYDEKLNPHGWLIILRMR